MTAQSPPPLTLEAARVLQNLLRAKIGPGLSERELDAVEARFGFTFSADHRVFLAAGLPHGSRRWPDWRNGEPEDLASRLSQPVEGVLFDVEHNGFWHPAWSPRPAETSDALQIARSELATVPQLIPVYSHRYLPGTAGKWGHPVLSVHQTDIIFYGNDLADYIRHEFTGRASRLPAHATVGFWSYFIGGGPGIDVTAPTPHTPYAVSAQEAVEYLRMLALERLIGRQHYPHQLVEAGLTALVLGVETESLPLLAGLSRTEHESADVLFDQVLAELGLTVGLPADDTGIPWEAARWELVRWWLRMIVNGSLDPGAGGDVITYEGWSVLARPRSLQPFADKVDAYDDWEAMRHGTREQPAAAIVAEAERLLAGPWPPLD
ncbi:hypothetical protein WEB32_00535 [Streptomyces netropsis]|uniref:Knr4/Smi1-like domain-containing protein n=1 Tax=Streptomyces netropsis TaxID=55404 RepID=A0A7W7LK04_STRNE|nr:hypothetical protein [Streptomyces netropsis]MBB4890986.1 hypothetical protein [Streptomyces netropsis]GGR50758.1 hypothetical protein GCM10010219_64920 [Streptomyces netropsis]